LTVVADGDSVVAVTRNPEVLEGEPVVATTDADSDPGSVDIAPGESDSS
jgi:hypothetical protein